MCFFVDELYKKNYSPAMVSIVHNNNNNNSCLTAIICRANMDQNVSILDFIRAKDDGGGADRWSYKS